VSAFIGYPSRQVLAVFDDRTAADRAAAAVVAALAGVVVQRYAGAADAERFDATGARHGLVARLRRAIQFSLMDQLPAMAWYEAAIRDGKVVLAVRTEDRTATLRAVAAMRDAGGHFINRFGRLATEEFVRWRGTEPRISSLMKH